MLIAPSWGGMLNGLLTLRGAWDKVRSDPVLKFMVAAITAYGMATLEGPLLSIKTVNSLSHYTDWTIAHVHVGAMGWNGFLTFSMLYYLFPRLYNTKLWSTKLANYHFWIGMLGILFYVIPIYVAGVTEGLMWKQFNKDGFLQYPNFLETILQVVPMFRLRAIGGTLYLVGTFMMAYNLYRTAKAGQFEPDTEAQAAALEKAHGCRRQIHLPPDARRQAALLHRACHGFNSRRRFGGNCPDVSRPGKTSRPLPACILTRRWKFWAATSTSAKAASAAIRR
jgi:cytochrome c oxidase cbb3-type subunit I/II